MASKGDKQGRILSQHITLSKSGKKIANNNMIVAPNLICCGMMLQLLCWMLKGIFYEIMERPWKRMDIK